jgi:hypothetical protein
MKSRLLIIVLAVNPANATLMVARRLASRAVFH